MQWVSLNARHLRAASYDPDRQVLKIRTSGGTTRTHDGILPHMFANLVDAEDQNFYYRFYLQASMVSDRRNLASIAVQVLKIGMAGVGALLLSAPGLII